MQQIQTVLLNISFFCQILKQLKKIILLIHFIYFASLPILTASNGPPTRQQAPCQCRQPETTSSRHQHHACAAPVTTRPCAFGGELPSGLRREGKGREWNKIEWNGPPSEACIANGAPRVLPSRYCPRGVAATRDVVIQGCGATGAKDDSGPALVLGRYGCAVARPCPRPLQSSHACRRATMPEWALEGGLRHSPPRDPSLLHRPVPAAIYLAEQLLSRRLRQGRYGLRSGHLKARELISKRRLSHHSIAYIPELGRAKNVGQPSTRPSGRCRRGARAGSPARRDAPSARPGHAAARSRLSRVIAPA
ncbi:hypothetical protein SS50377_25968 [Spironucleus salmonicida]|uniref:Uncharacterized protein n=1 Tax=Spironucleus salmonicida TaxID=348837 RepID=A0A9P8RWG1_9EUKA|nr:hypothetical protein SS50377_25968 [Spironucleus salmonicida]